VEAAISSIYDWSSTAGSITSVGGINIAEGMSPALVNDAIRAAMAIIRSSFDPSLQNFLNNSAQLPIANGGTGAATAAAALAALGGLGIAFQDLPGGNNQSAAFNFTDAMRGGGVEYTGAAAAATINPHATTAIGNRAVIVVRNNGTGALTLTPGSGVTLKKNGATVSSSAILAVGGVATLIQWNQDDWTASGSGIS
jgi:hypothetical protein